MIRGTIANRMVEGWANHMEPGAQPPTACSRETRDFKLCHHLMPSPLVRLTGHRLECEFPLESPQ